MAALATFFAGLIGFVFGFAVMDRVWFALMTGIFLGFLATASAWIAHNEEAAEIGKIKIDGRYYTLKEINE